MSAFKSPEIVKPTPGVSTIQQRTQLMRHAVPQSPIPAPNEDFNVERESFVSSDQMNRLLFGSPVGVISDASSHQHDDRRQSIGDFMALMGGSPLTSSSAGPSSRRQSVGMDLTEVAINPIQLAEEGGT